MLQNAATDPVADPDTIFIVPARQQKIINYSAVVDFLQLGFTAAGTGTYLVQSKTRDE